MQVERTGITRKEVVCYYADYDRRKKGQSIDEDLDSWPWNNSTQLDLKLEDVGLKKGVLAAYHTWDLATLGLFDLLECAVESRIFPGEPQTLGQLVLRGKLAEWLPRHNTTWWQDIGNGLDLGAKAALILRPALKSETPAKWYVEDGSGRAIALVQRILRYGETWRTAWAYVGKTADNHSPFISSRPELKV